VTTDRGPTPGIPVTCGTATSLAPGATTSCTGAYTATLADLDGGSIVVTATASNGTLTSAAATARSDSILRLLKDVTEPSFPAAGTQLHYTYLVTNRSTAPVDGPFAVSDDRTTATCQPALTLAAGASVFCTATYTVTDADVAAGSVTNTARGSGGGLSSNRAVVTVLKLP
jgi:hypothetical protein